MVEIAARSDSLTAGPELFFRYARPPNQLGYCGPDDRDAVRSLASEVVLPIDEVERVAGAFHGAWPYLELISREEGGSPLDVAVVEGYWLGPSNGSRVDMSRWGNSAADRFTSQAGTRWEHVAEAINLGGMPSHAFHVFCVYPWVGLLREGFVGPSLEVLDRCRISAGEVVSIDGDVAVVSRRPLDWSGNQLSHGEPTFAVYRLAEGLSASAGDLVSLHWDMVCQVLDRRRWERLRRTHDRHLSIANTRLTAARQEPGP